MNKIILLLIVICITLQPAYAMEYTAPEVTGEAAYLLPLERSDFGSDLWTVITAAVSSLLPQIYAAARICVALFALVMLLSLLKNIPGKIGQTAHLAGILAVSVLLLQNADSMISSAADTVSELSNYGKLLLPVMTAAMASSGAITSSTALYVGTTVFDAVLSGGIATILVPLVYVFLTLAVMAAATAERMLGALQDFVKWLVTWCLKLVLYIFTGYISITGVVSGAADAATLKATKLSMSGMIPVVGSILSDASEAVIVGAGLMRSTVGVYGLLAIIAICISPFLHIGVMYLLLKLTAALCEMFDVKPINDLIKSFSSAMGLLLGMTGSVCIMQLISVVCFMKGVT